MGAVSVVEVAGGMRTKERRDVSRLLTSMHTFPVSERVAWCAAEFMRTYRRSHSGVDLGDYLVAATAETEGCELATLNVRHYPMSQGLCPPLVL